MPYITIFIDGKYITSEDIQNVQIKDEVLGTPPTVVTLQGNDQVPVSIGQNDSGFGQISHRNLTNGGPWIGSSFLKENDSIYP